MVVDKVFSVLIKRKSRVNASADSPSLGRGYAIFTETADASDVHCLTILNKLVVGSFT